MVQHFRRTVFIVLSIEKSPILYAFYFSVNPQCTPKKTAKKLRNLVLQMNRSMREPVRRMHFFEKFYFGKASLPSCYYRILTIQSHFPLHLSFEAIVKNTTFWRLFGFIQDQRVDVTDLGGAVADPGGTVTDLGGNRSRQHHHGSRRQSLKSRKHPVICISVISGSTVTDLGGTVTDLGGISLSGRILAVGIY